MPWGQPPQGPTLSSEILSIHTLLNSPALVTRRLREISDQRFIADRIFRGTVEASGGAINYQVSESIYTPDDPEGIAPGGEYPRTLIPSGASALAKTTKYGQDVPVTDEAIGRLRGNAVDRGLLKVANRMVRFVDTISLTAAAAAITQTQAAAAAWSSGTADPFLDVMLAAAIPDDLGEGYVPDTVLVTTTLYARLVANSKVISGLARESSNTVTQSGDVTRIAGLDLVKAPAARFPGGVTVMVIDSQQFGYMGIERIPSPEYSGDPATGIETWARRDPDGNDQWLIRGRRPVVPIVQEPNAGVKITGA